jgi:hypothetical protein
MKPFERLSAEELEELEEQRETELRAENGGSCPGPVSLSVGEMDRRGFVRLGLGGALSLLFAQWLDPRMAWAQNAFAPKKAKACILLWMNGGPSHLETFDPKPGAATGGPTKAIKTSVPGLEISEHLPQVAEVAQYLAVLRGMTSKEGNHDRARYLMHTGYAPNPTIQHPSLGAWMSHQLGDAKSDLPNFVSISGPSMGAGFLGVQYGPFVVQNPMQPPQDVAYPLNVNTERFQTRQNALNMLEEQFAAETGQDIKVKGRRAVYARAVRMMHAPKLKAFDISEESEAVKKAYGESNFGKGCLVARRLVEAGVKFVEVVQDGWDTHNDNFNRSAKLLGGVDPGMATLIRELKERNLLDSTLVIWMGEFGRTPRINGNEGRDHYPRAWSAVLAGGGVRPCVYGATDSEGGSVVQDAITVPDFFATVATLLGMNPSHTMMTPVGRPISITEKGQPVRALIA